MAILKTALDEEILSKSQRQVCRAIYQMSQLHEAIIQLNKLELVQSTEPNPNGVTTVHDQYQDMKLYLLTQISQIMMFTKIPKLRTTKKLIVVSQT
jgi:hypothetical protein